VRPAGYNPAKDVLGERKPIYRYFFHPAAPPGSKSTGYIV
jgi:hypothetical protein